jgi:hypothetical protein
VCSRTCKIASCTIYSFASLIQIRMDELVRQIDHYHWLVVI